MVRLFLALFLAFQALGATIKLPSNAYPVGLAAAADGTLWFVGAHGGEAGRVLPGGEVERRPLPAPFYIERSAGIVVLGDGTVMIGSVTGVIARVDRQMNASLIDLGDRFTEVEDMVAGPDGAAWFIANTYFRHSVLGRVESGGAITTFPLPNRVSAMTVGPDGSFVIVGSQQILRATSKGAVEVIADCSQCWSDWVAVTADGTIWLATGRFEPGKGFAPRRVDGRASTIGSDGKVWIAADTNAIRALNADGTFREIPLAHPDKIPLSILSVGGVIWYGLSGALRSFDPGTPVDLHLGLGDIVAIEMEQNRYFEGEHQVLAFHRRGGTPFVRRILRSAGQEYEGSGIYALSASRILFEEPDYWVDREIPLATVLDGEGVPSGSIVGPQDTSGHGVVVDRNGTIHAL